MKRHCCMRIRALLAMSDKELDMVRDMRITMDGKEFTDRKALRRALADALADGQECIKPTECDNFDPKIGCLGHE